MDFFGSFSQAFPKLKLRESAELSFQLEVALHATVPLWHCQWMVL
jgi:hypothetical protein